MPNPNDDTLPQHATVTQVRRGPRSVGLGQLGTSRGYCIATPKIGESMVMYNESGRRRIVTTPVLRLLRSPDGVYAQTRNSVYRLEPTTREQIETAIASWRRRARRSRAPG